MKRRYVRFLGMRRILRIPESVLHYVVGGAYVMGHLATFAITRAAIHER